MPPPRPDPKAKGEQNSYIPAFISKKPFYAKTGEAGPDGNDESTDYLEHQRLQKKDKVSKLDAFLYSGKTTKAATRWRKGACENCGSMSHKRRDCIERPRKMGAKWSGKDIQADYSSKKNLDDSWDGKRDRWAGYDTREYRQTVEDYNQMEELRRQAREKVEGEDEGNEEDGDRYAEVVDPTKHQSTATRQLRIREDTAKYLLSLDLDSARYNPKTRALVDAGAVGAAGEDGAAGSSSDRPVDKTAELFAEEGLLKASGDASEFERAQRYAWESQERSGDTVQHLQANPTAGEFQRRQEREAESRRRQEREKELRDRYGGEEHGAMPDEVRRVAAANHNVTESEHFVEYDEFGAVKGAPKTVARSKYPEDVLHGNHTTVWGSWWSDFQWGYGCCHSFVKNSYCTGDDGKKAFLAAQLQRAGLITEKEQDGDDEEMAEGSPEPKKRAAKKRTAADMMGGVTEEELDEYRKKRAAANDPMANLLGKDNLVQ